MKVSNAIIIFIHVLLTYTFFIHSYSPEQLNFIFKYVGSKVLVQESKDFKYKPALVKNMILEKFPSNALSVF